MEKAINLFKFPVYIFFSYFLVVEAFVGIEILFLPRLLASILLYPVIIPYFFILQARKAVLEHSNFLIPLLLCLISVAILISNIFKPYLMDFSDLYSAESCIFYVYYSTAYSISYFFTKLKKENLI